MEEKIILCCLPLSWNFVPRQFFLSWYDMHQYSLGKYRLALMTSDGAYSDTLRDDMAKNAMLINCDYIYWIDADQTYPSNSPEVLMKHIDSGKMIVGGVTPHRANGYPNIYAACDDSPLYKQSKTLLGGGLVKVDATGLGGIMMNPEVFRKMEYPWFRMSWDKEINDRLGMDFTFYKNCERAGIDVWCDTDLVYGHLITQSIPLRAEKGLLTLCH